MKNMKKMKESESEGGKRAETRTRKREEVSRSKEGKRGWIVVLIDD